MWRVIWMRLHAISNADSRSMLTGAPMRKLPGSVELAHTRNLQPDMAAAHAAGLEARAAVAQDAKSYVKLNAYRGRSSCRGVVT